MLFLPISACIDSNKSNKKSIDIIFEEGTQENEINSLLYSYNITKYDINFLTIENETGIYEVFIVSITENIENEKEFINSIKNEPMVSEVHIEYADI